MRCGEVACRNCPKLTPLTHFERKAHVPAWTSWAAVLVLLTGGAVLLGSTGVIVSTRLLTAAFLTLAFAGGAYAMRAVTQGGAWAGAVVSFSLYATAGPGAFLALLAVFLLAFISTRVGQTRKLKLGKAENRRGRSAVQVLANLGMAAVFGAFTAFGTGHLSDVLLIASAGALAEAACDTVSSECGVAWADRVRLITTWEAVAPGTDGGLSASGTLAGAVAAVIVAGVCAAGRMIPLSAVPIVAGAGVLGTFFDSVVGATLQRRGLIGNNAVNVAGTTFAALLALAIAVL